MAEQGAAIVQGRRFKDTLHGLTTLQQVQLPNFLSFYFCFCCGFWDLLHVVNITQNKSREHIFSTGVCDACLQGTPWFWGNENHRKEALCTMLPQITDWPSSQLFRLRSHWIMSICKPWVPDSHQGVLVCPPPDCGPHTTIVSEVHFFHSHCFALSLTGSNVVKLKKRYLCSSFTNTQEYQVPYRTLLFSRGEAYYRNTTFMQFTEARCKSCKLFSCAAW